ncbi:4Fe-4S binding protein [Methanosphaera sp.]
MKPIVFEDLSTFLVKHVFHLRFKVASLTRKSRIMNKIITKVLFDKDGTYFIPSTNSVTTNTINMNQTIPQADKIVFPSDIIKEVIRKANYIVIMNKCLCRNSAGCEDYPIDLGCIFMGKATKQISRKYCREVTAQEAINHIDKCNDAGLIHIMGRNKMDVTWMNVHPGEELLTVCNCCPCCCLWRVLPNLSDSIQENFFKLPGVSIYYDASKCIGCKKCIDVCFAQAISLKNEKIELNENTCIGCGQCSNNCPVDALQLNYENINVDSVFNKIDSLVNIEN